MAKQFKERRQHPMQKLLEKNYSTRYHITLFILGTFVLIIIGIIWAISAATPLNQEWKEILLLLLGAFIGIFGRVMDFWFNNVDNDKEIIKRADNEDSGLETPNENGTNTTTPKVLLG